MSAGTLMTAAVDQRRSRGRSMLSLARVEAGHILRHPAFLLGLVVVVLAIATVPEDWVDGQFLALTQAVIVAMGIGTLIAAALVAGRQRFLSEPDLFPPPQLPVPIASWRRHWAWSGRHSRPPR
jgi:hypothetical protein